MDKIDFANVEALRTRMILTDLKLGSLVAPFSVFDTVELSSNPVFQKLERAQANFIETLCERSRGA